MIQSQLKHTQILFAIFFFLSTERVWMVQTESQYICIYQCLLLVLDGKENTSPVRQIHDNQGYEGKFHWDHFIIQFECNQITLTYQILYCLLICYEDKCFIDNN